MSASSNKLSEALDNEANESILNLTSLKILELNLSILKELHLSRETTLDYLKKLKGYRYIDEMNELKYGAYIRWIPITDPNNLHLKYCGIVCDIKITDNGIVIVCKNFMHRCYSFRMDNCLIFQKLTNQEQVILSALDHITNEETVEEEPNADTNANDSSESDSESEDSDED
jgi:hypothetical protein